jgi:Bacterial cell division membrane protein
MLNDFNLRYMNFRLIIYVLILSSIGVLVVSSATINTVNDGLGKRQVMGIILGMLTLVCAMIIDYKYYIKLGWLFYAASIACLLLVFIFGTYRGGARRWIELPIIGQFQPSEVAKIMLIIFFAMYLSKIDNKLNSPLYLLSIVGFAAVPVFSIFRQPNLSTTIVLTFIIIAMSFVAGLSYKWIIGTVGVLVPSMFIIVRMVMDGRRTFLNTYMENRILAFFRPDNFAGGKYQQENSVMAIASGMLNGKGLNTNALDSVKNGKFLPEVQTDFIFAIIGEELGFVGSIVVITLIALIVMECLIMAAKAKNLEGRLICSGIAALIAFQSFTNIAVATNIFPNTGLPLPFVSYGLTSLVSSFVGIGLVLNIGIYGRKNKLGGQIDEYRFNCT